MKKPEKKRILIADSSKESLRELLHARESNLYQIETVQSGNACLKKLKEGSFDLLLVDLFLSEIHGIEILRRVKTNPKMQKMGVVLTCAQTMIQNYHSALQIGADYFLEKPYDPSFFYEIVKRFFLGKLSPPPFGGKESSSHIATECYIPKLHSHHTYVKFWGTRGSNPVSGRDYMRYGGNTSCLEVRHGNDLLILDGGTGIRSLGSTPFVAKQKTIHLVIGHTHWDHVIGFPFFAPIYNPDCQLHIYAPIGYGKTIKELFTEMFAYSYFPVRLDDIRAKLVFKEIEEGVPFNVGDIEVNSHYAFHPGPTLCFKIRAGKKTFGYATDNEMLMGYHGSPSEIGKNNPLLAPQLSLVQFFKDCDFLIHEAQYFPLEYQEKVGWGHSSISNASVLIKHAGVKEWIVTHHDPEHTDDDLHRKMQWHHDIMDDNKIPCRVRFAFDGLTLPL